MHEMLLLAQQGNGTGVALFAGGFFLVFLGIIAIGSIFWIWMLIDCLTSNLPSMEKLIWILVIFFLHLIGALIYFFVGRPGRTVAR